jgi:hypothetical protein
VDRVGVQRIVRPANYNLKAEACDWSVLRIELDAAVFKPIVWPIP